MNAQSVTSAFSSSPWSLCLCFLTNKWKLSTRWSWRLLAKLPRFTRLISFLQSNTSSMKQHLHVSTSGPKAHFCKKQGQTGLWQMGRNDIISRTFSPFRENASVLRSMRANISPSYVQDSVLHNHQKTSTQRIVARFLLLQLYFAHMIKHTKKANPQKWTPITKRPFPFFFLRFTKTYFDPYLVLIASDWTILSTSSTLDSLVLPTWFLLSHCCCCCICWCICCCCCCCCWW